MLVSSCGMSHVFLLLEEKESKRSDFQKRCESGEIYGRVILRFIVVGRINFSVGAKLRGDRATWSRCTRLTSLGYLLLREHSNLLH